MMGRKIWNFNAPYLKSEHHTFLSRRFAARADEHRGLRASIHGDVQDVCGNEDVISRTHHVSKPQLIASHNSISSPLSMYIAVS
jgi:hypothetical protein